MKKEIFYAQLNNPQRGITGVVSRTSNRHKDTRMRKYYQTALLITAVVSLVSLLFYRHEYNRLRYVLEVFNYFGKPSQEGIKINCPKESSEVKKIQIGLNEPFSAWQRLDDDLFVYSSYITNNRKVQTISYGKLNNPNLDCNIFFDDLLTPIPGIFSFSILGNTSDIPGHTAYRGYILICEYTEPMTPVGVTYQPRDQVLFNSNSPILSVKSQPKLLKYDGSALCVAPPLNMPMSRADMISFLNFHELVGMSHFVIYDYGIPNVFHKALKNMAQDSNPQWNFTYEVIPWNFPIREIHSNVIKNIIETDCLYRTFNKVMYAATISWEEYIVLKYHHVVSDLLVDFEKTKIFGNRYIIQTQTFCTQQKDDKRSTNSTPIILKKIYTSPNALDANSIYIYKPHESVNVKHIQTLKTASNLIVANRYVSCNDYNVNNPESNKYEKSILRFAGDLQNSPIFRRFIAGKMFDIE
ncbi:uncharacterized protein LOC131663437 [Phymastichus coffea]|uniref:uncharacterized protein LOC131663437 n=1 Tax=Phymastichus coffea TaxID=108790 RepID=UPI00273B1D96|nr:uncharacterized protein LOC131663437 [Phymastichus coffea]